MNDSIGIHCPIPGRAPAKKNFLIQPGVLLVGVSRLQTSVCGQDGMVESQHAESGTYGREISGVFGQAVEGTLGRARADAKLTRDRLP
jgi:hypothetical protein